MQRKRRSDSFFGLHFDFHARRETVVGEVMEPDVIARLLDATMPDYVQIDSKGHPGFSSYPTKCGTPAPEMRADPIRMWRDLTAERGIALYAHHSGLFDMDCAVHHPEWAVVDKDGNVSDRYLSVFGSYADEFLIPQLTELALDYGIDGAWVDGEVWATQVDYSEMARRAWAKLSDTEPPMPEDENYPAYLAFCRKGFEDYVAHYVARMREIAPDFQVTSNWIYSAYMPKSPDVPVAFLSGDYSPGNSVNSARLNGRFLACQNLPWDLMAWGHNSAGTWTTNNRNTKELVQHCQEASYVMSLGGGFQFYNIQYGGGGTVQAGAIPVWAGTAKFVRAREPFCKGTKLVPQVGIVTLTEAHDAELSTLYHQGSPSMTAAKGLIGAVQDAGYSSEILLTHNLMENDLAAYGAIILGRARCIAPESRAKLLDYVKNGGSLLLASAESAALFADVLGIAFAEPEQKLIHLAHDGVLAPFETLTADFASTAGDVCGQYYLDNFEHDGPYPAAIRVKLGSGSITALCFDLGSIYYANRSSCMTAFVKSQLKALFPMPVAEVSGSDYAELTVTERGGRLFVHVLNYGGPHEVPGIRSYNELPCPGPITVKLHLPKSPKRITIEPEHKVWEGNPAEVVLDKLEIHTILAIEF